MRPTVRFPGRKSEERDFARSSQAGRGGCVGGSQLASAWGTPCLFHGRNDVQESVWALDGGLLATQILRARRLRIVSHVAIVENPCVASDRSLPTTHRVGGILLRRSTMNKRLIALVLWMCLLALPAVALQWEEIGASATAVPHPNSKLPSVIFNVGLAYDGAPDWMQLCISWSVFEVVSRIRSR